MTIASADALSRHLKPLCPRDNHVMKYYQISEGSGPDLTIRSDHIETQTLDTGEINSVEHVCHTCEIGCRLVVLKGILDSSR